MLFIWLASVVATAALAGAVRGCSTLQAEMASALATDVGLDLKMSRSPDCAATMPASCCTAGFRAVDGATASAFRRARAASVGQFVAESRSAVSTQRAWS